MATALKAFTSALLLLFLLASYIIVTTPDPRPIQGCLTTSMFNVRLCPGTENYVHLKNMSRIFIDTILASEDSSFYSHNGFDWSELESSFKENMHSGRYVRGGSTITQQLAKNVFLNNQKSLLRKFREAILARQIEAILSKDQILERYLNVIEFGPNLFGIKKAARHYFDKSPSELNLLESAYLAYLLPNPKVHSQSFSSGKLTKYGKFRVLTLCYRMLRFRKISTSDYEFAKNSVDSFPWKDLSFTTTAPTDAAQENQFESENDSLPELDSSVTEVPPEPEPESDSQTVPETETNPENQDASTSDAAENENAPSEPENAPNDKTSDQKDDQPFDQ